jgi:hypothetical protein
MSGFKASHLLTAIQKGIRMLHFSSQHCTAWQTLALDEEFSRFTLIPNIAAQLQNSVTVLLYITQFREGGRKFSFSSSDFVSCQVMT